MNNSHPEDAVWLNIDPDDIWVLDKLILSRKLGYVCGPVGLDVPKSSYYIVRPCVNMIGLGLSASKEFLVKGTSHLLVGCFWCEWFEGKHISVDYEEGKQVLAVEGYRTDKNLAKWDKWVKVDIEIPMPKFLIPLSNKYKTINCEYIGDKLIEVHLRENTDFSENITEFIPVWKDQQPLSKIDMKEKGYRYISCPEYNGRVGAYIK